MERKEHIEYIESKIAKNIRLLYKAKPYIDKHLLLSLYPITPFLSSWA